MNYQRKYFILSLLLVIIIFEVHGQHAMLQGNITFNDVPEPFVNVVIDGLSIGDVTDEEGNFRINWIPIGTRQVTVVAMGFKLQKKDIFFEEGKLINLNFKLKLDDDKLDEIVISGTLVAVSKRESPVAIEVYSKGFFKKKSYAIYFRIFTKCKWDSATTEL